MIRCMKELKASLEESHKEKFRLVDELNEQQARPKSSVGATPPGLESLKFELKTRDDLIGKLRQEVLALQEKRDHIYAELDSVAAKHSQLECRLFFKEEEVGCSGFLFFLLALSFTCESSF